MLQLVDANWKSPEDVTTISCAPGQVGGHLLVEYAQQALAAGDELIACVLLDLAYEVFDNQIG